MGFSKWSQLPVHNSISIKAKENETNFSGFSLTIPRRSTLGGSPQFIQLHPDYVRKQFVFLGGPVWPRF